MFEIFLVIAIFIFILMLPNNKEQSQKDSNRRSILFYGVFVSLGAFSPVIGIIFALWIGVEFSTSLIFPFLWIGVGLSLPASLLLSRTFGKDSYDEYWSYLQSFSGSSRRSIVLIWAAAVVATVTIGLAYALLEF